MATIKILVAEDEKPIAHALELKLTKAGFQPTIASNGQEALDFLAKEKYDLVVLDLVMPQVNGFGVLEEMQKRGLKDVPVIITSNLGQEEDKKRAVGLGALEYIVKSDTPISSIVEKIQEVVKKKVK